MITIRGIEIDFDITAPNDMLRLETAQEAADERAKDIPEPPTDETAPDYLKKYIGWLQANIKIVGDFWDEVFGDGVAEKLLTNNPSLTKIFDVNEEVEAALGVHVKVISTHMSKYKPNRATRRAKK